MLVARIGAIFLLVGYGFAIAQLGHFMYVTAREGYSSWWPYALLVLPAGLTGLASALLVMWRKPLGNRLAILFCVLLTITAIWTFAKAPPVGRFLGDYENAALARGVDVPEYLQGRKTPQDIVEDETAAFRSQGALGSIGVAIVYGLLVLRSGTGRRPSPATKSEAKA
jgi:hypothetical protein